MSVTSSPSHAQKMSVRFGRWPFFSISPSDRVVSMREDVPLLGSTPPKTHASWWLPRVIHSSGRSLPLMRASTTQFGCTSVRISTFMWMRASPPSLYSNPIAPCHSFGAGGPPRLSMMGLASRHDSGTPMIVGTETASSFVMRCAPGVDAQPGVSGSPGTM